MHLLATENNSSASAIWAVSKAYHRRQTCREERNETRFRTTPSLALRKSTLMPISRPDVHRQSRMYSTYVFKKEFIPTAQECEGGNWMVASRAARAILKAGNNLKHAKSLRRQSFRQELHPFRRFCVYSISSHFERFFQSCVMCPALLVNRAYPV